MSSKKLKPRALEILRLLSLGNYASQIANTLGINRSTVSFWTKKLEHEGFINCVVSYPFKKYSLTDKSSKILTRSEAASLCSVEDYPVKYEVVKWENISIDWRKLGEPRNWEKMGFRHNGVMVEKTSKSIIIHSGQMSGDDPYELAYYAGRICDNVARVLAERFGMVLGIGEPLRKPMIHIYDPIYDELAKRAAISVDNVGSIDRSPPTLKGHAEYPVDLAKEVLTAPLYLREINQSLKILSQGQATNDKQIRILIDAVILICAKLDELVDELKKGR